jgi:hypothetical protein
MQITPAPHYNGRSDAMMPIEEAIIETLRRTDPCYLDEVVMYLPNFSWGEIFIAVDRMSRDKRLLLRKHGCSDYQIVLGSQFAHLTSTTSQKVMQSTGRATTEGTRDDEKSSGCITVEMEAASGSTTL